MAKKFPTLNLPSADDLFTIQEERDDASREKVVDIPLHCIDSFPDHPFLVKMDDSMQAMVDSVKAVGVQTPAVVCIKDDGRYELVSGHRRKMACELSGLTTLPCIIRNFNRDESIIAMVDSNLQREVILPSEKAKSYKMRLEAMKRQGHRTDLSSVPLAQKSERKVSRALLGEVVGESQDQVRRYIRLTELIPPMLEMVDDGKIAMRPAVELSYLPQEQQELLQKVVEIESRAPTHIQAAKLRKLSDEGCLNRDTIISILQETKSTQTGEFKLPLEKIQRFFPSDTPAQKIEETIIDALDLWHNSKKSRPD